jgi:predicted ATPase/DNA-binding SARP family transcriptional activator
MHEFRVLGPLEVSRSGQPVDLPGPASRRVLAALVLRAGTWVSVDRLIDELWGERPPATARKALQMHVSRLRAALDAGAPEAKRLIVGGSAGYRLEVDPSSVDAARFERLVAEARGALERAEPVRQRALLLQALALWRGPPLPELSLEGALAGELQRLQELRLQAIEERIDADLQLGGARESIGELRGLVAEHPWRERLHEHLMLALHQAGRQAEALEAYRQARTVLVEQLGIEPGPRLRDVHQAVLEQNLDTPQPSATALPRPSTSLFGREADLERLTELVAEARLVTLIGPGGVGKTRLAIEAARRLEADFADGTTFVALAPLAQPGELATAIAVALAAQLQESEPPAATLRRFLAGRHLLLVLDNFEHLLAGATLVAELVSACPRLTILLTSREPLRLTAERSYSVQPLALPVEAEPSAAVELFCDRARAHDAGFSLDADSAPHVREICRRLDGLPLALELAAAHTALLPPGELAARLNLALLTGGARDWPERHRALRATIDASYAPLDSDQQIAFGRMATFAGPVSIDAALAVTGAAVATLEALVDRQLLVRRDHRLGMLETIREYAAERLADNGDADADHLRHARYWMSIAEQSDRGFEGPDWRAWRVRTLEAVNEFRAASSWSIAHGHTELALRTATALRTFWAFSNQHPEAHRWLTDALTADGGHSPPRVRAAALWARSMLPNVSLDQAEQDAADALAMYERAGDPAGMALCLAAASGFHSYRGEIATASAIADQAADLAESAGDAIAMTWAYWFRVDVATFERAQAHLPAALALAHWTGADWRAPQLLQRVAFIAIAEGHYGEARLLHAEALAPARRAHDDQCVAAIHGDEAIACLLTDDDAAAAGAAAAQLALARRKRVTWITYGLLVTAALAARRDLADDAAALYGRAEQLLGARVRYVSERKVFRRITERHLETLRAAQPLRWSLGMERGRSMTFDALIDLALDTCDLAPPGS